MSLGSLSAGSVGVVAFEPVFGAPDGLFDAGDFGRAMRAGGLVVTGGGAAAL
jgi:hypothetical protein